MSVKLWSPKGNLPDGSTHIGLTNGTSFIVPHEKEGIEVPARFRKEAIARGCIPVGMEDDEEGENNGFDRKKAIREGLNKMMDSDEPGLFSTSGRPVLAKLSKVVGFTVDRSEVNDVWAEFEKGKDDDDKASTINVGASA